jgi:hypothetical protein
MKQAKGPKRPRGRPPGPATQAARERRKLTNDVFFEAVATRPDKSAAMVTVYRADPKTDAALIESPEDLATNKKVLEVIPADRCTQEYMESHHGYGLYSLYLNDANDRSAYCEALIDLRDNPALYEEMMTPGRCKIDLRTVLVCNQNDGYIKAWKARGMWPDAKEEARKAKEAEEQEEMSTLATVTEKLIDNQLNRGADLSPLLSAMQEHGRMLQQMMMQMMQNFQQQTAPQPPQKSAAEIQAEIDQRVQIAKQQIELDLLKDRLAKAENAPPAAGVPGAGGVLAPLEKRMLDRMLRDAMARVMTDEPEPAASPWLEFGRMILNEAAPAVKSIVARKLNSAATAPSANPAAAGAAAPLPGEGYDDEGEETETEDELYERLIDGVCRMFLHGKPAAGAAIWIVDVEEQEGKYREFQKQGAATLDLLALVAPQLPSAAQALGRRAEFAAWLEQFYAYYPTATEKEEVPAQ